MSELSEAADRIRTTLPMSVVLDLLDLPQPDRSGKIPCVAHEENTPSLHIYEDHFSAYCCGTGGDQIAFVMWYLGCSWAKAVRFLEGEADVERPELPKRREREVIDLTMTLHDYWALAPLPPTDAETYCARRWNLGYEWLHSTFDVVGWDNCLHIPHYNGDRVVGIKTKYFSGVVGAVEGSTFTTRLYSGVLGLDGCVICEGESDVWAMSEYKLSKTAHFGVYGLPAGASTWRHDWVEDWDRATRIWLCLDNDDAGRRASMDILAELTKQGFMNVKIVTPPEKDVADSLMKGWQPIFS